jgi:hypothetical protein
MYIRVCMYIQWPPKNLAAVGFSIGSNVHKYWRKSRYTCRWNERTKIFGSSESSQLLRNYWFWMENFHFWLNPRLSALSVGMNGLLNLSHFLLYVFFARTTAQCGGGWDHSIIWDAACDFRTLSGPNFLRKSIYSGSNKFRRYKICA